MVKEKMKRIGARGIRVVIPIANMPELTQYVDFIGKKWPNARQLWRLYKSGNAVGLLQMRKDGTPKKFNLKLWNTFDWKKKKAKFGKGPEKIEKVFWELLKKMTSGKILATFTMEKVGNKFKIKDTDF